MASATQSYAATGAAVHQQSGLLSAGMLKKLLPGRLILWIARQFLSKWNFTVRPALAALTIMRHLHGLTLDTTLLKILVQQTPCIPSIPDDQGKCCVLSACAAALTRVDDSMCISHAMVHIESRLQQKLSS